MRFPFELDTEDLDTLSDVLEDESPDVGLRRLTRSISGQYVEVVAGYARASMLGEDLAVLQTQLDTALQGLLRLSRATGDGALEHTLVQLTALVPEAVHLGGRRRELYLRDLREWILDFAALLAPQDAARLQSMVKFDDRARPLLHRLLEVYGMGPRRLERLYCAGLFSVESLLMADPAEIAQVTGMSERLARSVIYAAQRFDLVRRQDCARHLLDQAQDAIALAREAHESGRMDPGVLHAMRTASQVLAEALSEITPEEEA